jgi:inner membrane protein YidH
MDAARATDGGGAERAADAELDYRFTLANERTFLAWMRTALGLLAGGVAVRQLIEPIGGGGRTVLALLAIGASIVLSTGGYLRWRAVQRAMRSGTPLPAAPLVPLAAAGIAIVAIVAFVLMATA